MYYGEVEGTGFEVIDGRFRNLLTGHGRVERVWTGGRWTEGPAWFAAGRYLVFSDIPNNRLMRFDECDGNVSVFRGPSNNCNGNTTDPQGRLVTCEHLTRRVTRTEFDGTITVIADRFNGKRFNSPNDVVVKSDGSIWFTDPSYGILTDYEGIAAPQELERCNVYRVDGQSGDITVVADDFLKPNGIAFSRDESLLYIADTGLSHDPTGPKHIRVFKVNSDGKSLGTSKVFADCSAGFFDGFRIDRQDRLWSSAGDGVHCFMSSGDLIGKIKLPEICGNVCFGGPLLNRLFMCGTTSLYSAYLAING
jgi:gluconolactonase